MDRNGTIGSGATRSTRLVRWCAPWLAPQPLWRLHHPAAARDIGPYQLRRSPGRSCPGRYASRRSSRPQLLAWPPAWRTGRGRARFPLPTSRLATIVMLEAIEHRPHLRLGVDGREALELAGHDVDGQRHARPVVGEPAAQQRPGLCTQSESAKVTHLGRPAAESSTWQSCGSAALLEL